MARRAVVVAADSHDAGGRARGARPGAGALADSAPGRGSARHVDALGVRARGAAPVRGVDRRPAAIRRSRTGPLAINPTTWSVLR